MIISDDFPRLVTIGGDACEFPRSCALCYGRRCEGSPRTRSTLWAVDVCVSVSLYHYSWFSSVSWLGSDASVFLGNADIILQTSPIPPPSPIRSALTVFTKCKESLEDGRRLENISWRLWHRELVQAQVKAQSPLSSSVACPPYQPLTPVSMTPSQLDDSGRSSPTPSELPDPSFIPNTNVVMLSCPQLDSCCLGE